MDIRVISNDEKKNFAEGLMTLMLAAFVFALLLDRGWTVAAVAEAVGTIGTILYISFGK
jgi:hypothetical protein